MRLPEMVSTYKYSAEGEQGLATDKRMVVDLLRKLSVGYSFRIVITRGPSSSSSGPREDKT